MKYSKEFIFLCSSWLRGEIQDKSKFSPFLSLMLDNSFNTTGYRIWEFEGEECKNVIFNEGDIEIEPNPIESCFSLENNVHWMSGKRQDISVELIESINSKLCMWVSKVKLITRWSDSLYFDVYEPIKEALSNKELFSVDEIKLLQTRYDFYSHQREILHLKEYDNISSGEILYVLIEKDLIDYYKDDFLGDPLDSIIYGEMNDYYVFYNDDDFRNIFSKHKSYNDIFASFADLMLA